MSFISESLVLMFLGSIFLGPKRVMKLTADLTRLKLKLQKAQQEISEQLNAELAEAGNLTKETTQVAMPPATPPTSQG